MTTQTSTRDWAKARLDEMNAKVAMLEGKVSQLQGNARAEAESALADMRSRRDAFQETVKKEGEEDGKSAEAALTRARSTLETHVSAFEASAKKALSHNGGEAQ